MPYKSNKELPQDVRESLPTEAQDVYRHAYNVACDPRKPAKDFDENASREAWIAVEREFEWSDDNWHRKEDKSKPASKGNKERFFGMQAPARGGRNDGEEARSLMEEEELESTAPTGQPGRRQTSSQSVRQKDPDDDKQWTPGRSHTTPYRSSGGEKQRENPAPSHEIERERESHREPDR